VPWEFAELTAGLPFALSLAFTGAVFSLKAGRKRSTLNQALHELRRPLQTLALLVPEADDAVDSTLRLATMALARLDREVNGGGDPVAGGPVAVRPLLDAAVGRCGPRAALLGRALAARWAGPEALLPEAALAVSQVLDNLISNGLEHGTGGVLLEGRLEGARVRLVVRDEGGGEPRRRPGWRGLRSRLGGRVRRGHGLQIVRRTAAELGGSFRLRREAGGTEAILLLPAWGGDG
jgi:signal transduction histidine kinase